ncbi:MAG TPA: DUF1501 domain-containing protein [Candidatus Limnocylindrales bacterium]|nr:DUF1501 domain-containing protein [Candidatus Limnocylindrales bacterium]
MDTLTRRKFLIASGVVGGAALAAGATALTLRDILATSGDRPEAAGTLVVVTLYGGNDGLNTVIPHADPAYRSARPELAYQGSEVLRLDDATGLNPALKEMHGLFGAGRLAVVRGVGYPKPDRSHFRSMDIWHTAQPERPGTTGWLGRWLDRAGGDPRLAVSFENVLPPLLAGASSAGAVVGLREMKLPVGIKAETLTALGQGAQGASPLLARACHCFTDLVRVDEMIRDVKEAADSTPDEPAPGGTGTGGQTALAEQLDLVAQCIEAKAATRVFSVSLGGFDTHADEKEPHQALLGILDKAIGSFWKRMSKVDTKVVMLIYSEFGRRVKANASDGTDHGTASNLFLIGEGVKGGLHGDQPSLTDLDNGDLKFGLDFRDVYAALVERVLEADPGPILGGWRGRAEGVL